MLSPPVHLHLLQSFCVVLGGLKVADSPSSPQINKIQKVKVKPGRSTSLNEAFNDTWKFEFWTVFHFRLTAELFITFLDLPPQKRFKVRRLEFVNLINETIIYFINIGLVSYLSAKAIIDRVFLFRLMADFIVHKHYKRYKRYNLPQKHTLNFILQHVITIL